MRYKANSTVRTGLEELQQSSKLLARHLRLTGDERLVFNEWQNEMQRKALGYYDPKTDKIDLNRLSEDTLNHETLGASRQQTRALNRHPPILW